jgi:hypothetical protein
MDGKDNWKTKWDLNRFFWRKRCFCRFKDNSWIEERMEYHLDGMEWTRNEQILLLIHFLVFLVLERLLGFCRISTINVVIYICLCSLQENLDRFWRCKRCLFFVCIELDWKDCLKHGLKYEWRWIGLHCSCK